MSKTEQPAWIFRLGIDYNYELVLPGTGERGTQHVQSVGQPSAEVPRDVPTASDTASNGT
jgi:hypothetical protein